MFLDVCQQHMTVSETLLPTCRLPTLSNWPSSCTINLRTNVHTAQISIQLSIQVIRTVLLLRIFCYFADITCATTLPLQTGHILQYRTTYCRITSTARYKKHFQILHSEFGSIMKGSVKKYNNVLWHLSVVTVGVYWRLLWSTAVCHI